MEEGCTSTGALLFPFFGEGFCQQLVATLKAASRTHILHPGPWDDPHEGQGRGGGEGHTRFPYLAQAQGARAREVAAPSVGLLTDAVCTHVRVMLGLGKSSHPR